METQDRYIPYDVRKSVHTSQRDYVSGNKREIKNRIKFVRNFIFEKIKIKSLSKYTCIWLIVSNK